MGSDISYLNPENLRFSKDHIDDKFDNGVSLEKSYHEILNGNLDIDSFPPLQVVKECLPYAPFGFSPNYWVVKGNRRLYLYRKLKTIGAVSTVRAAIDGSTDKVLHLKANQTTKNGGQSVTVKTNSYLEETLNATGAAWQEVAVSKDKYGKMLLGGAAAFGVLLLIGIWATRGEKSTPTLQRM